MVWSVLQRVFSQIKYIVGATGIIFLVLSTVLLLPNKAVIVQVFASEVVGLKEKLTFFFSIYGTVFTNYSLVSGFLLLFTALLFAVNLSLLVFYIRRRQVKALDKKAHLASIGGLISASLGIGCAACGSVVLTAVFGLAGAGSFLVLLPFQGAEFGVLGVLLLLLSIWYLIKKINDPLVCSV